MNNYFRQVGFGLSYKESIPGDPLKWATDQFNSLPPLNWSEELPSVEDQREIFRQYITEKEKIQEKFGKDAMVYESELNKLRHQKGEKFFQAFELSIRHHNALNNGEL